MNQISTRTSSLLLQITLLTTTPGFSSSEENSNVETHRPTNRISLSNTICFLDQTTGGGWSYFRQAACRVHSSWQIQVGPNKVSPPLSGEDVFMIWYSRSQLEYDTFFKNYELNQQLYFDMAGIRTFEDTSKFWVVQYLYKENRSSFTLL